MWSFVALVFFITRVEGQNGRDTQEHHGHGWDIRLAVPGEPGSDYPTLGSIPRTSFSCAGKEPGYYADLETSCQVFRVCTVGSTYGFQSFLCPNGTLFNQAVFVCDWWMNVNCAKSEQLFDYTGERFGNLRLGPQLMKDIKKMLTHPMQNPYDKTEMRSNLIVMQDYKPPFGQLFPNGALISSPERTPNSVYFPAKQIQSSSLNGYGENDLAFAASTPDPRYLPAAFNTFQQEDAEAFQRQRQNAQSVQRDRLIQNTQTLQSGNVVSNGHAGQIIQPANAILSNNFNNAQVTRPTQNYNEINSQFGQKQRNNVVSTYNMQNAIPNQRGQFKAQTSQYTDSRKLSRLNGGKQSELGVTIQQQNNIHSNQEKQPYIYSTPSTRLSNSLGNTETRQNLVRTEDAIPPTIIAKTLTYSRLIQDPKPGKPKSRITVKTWIVKPSKSGKLIQPTPYTYNRPTLTPAAKLTDNTTPYVYNKPTTLSQSGRLVSQSDQPYVYNRPTVAANLVATTIRDFIPTYPAPTTPQPTLSGRQYLAPTPSPTRASRLYLAPTTFKPAARIYLPPNDNEFERPLPARQYLAPNAIQQPTFNPNEQLRVFPTTSTSTFSLASSTSNTNSPTFAPTQATPPSQEYNTNNKNLTFADILTKEKLDITVNDIVKHTSNFLNTSPGQFSQLTQEDSVDYPGDVYLPPSGGVSTDSDEILTTQTPSVAPKSSRLIVGPSVDLEPPEETYNNNQITNQLSNLPFFKEPPSPTNTIERTVSLKISLPEKVASYLFKRRNNDSDYDKLEILNTGSSNYLVLTNNQLDKNTGRNFIPIGRLIENKNSSTYNSQALVFSLLADSINVAKEYSNLAEQEIVSATSPTQFQNVNDEELTQITNRISQLTSSQYGGNNNNINSAKIISTAQTTPNTVTQYNGANVNNIIQNQRVQQFSTSPPQQNTQIQYSTRFQSDISSMNANLLNSNQNQVYSGQLYQLPVPDVTDQIYNRQNFANLIQTNNDRTSMNPNLNNNANNLVKPMNPHVEIVQSQTSPLPPARLQLHPTPSNELDSFNHNQESLNELLNTGNGISAQFQDRIVGTLPQLVDNKRVSYKKDQTYYLYSNVDNSLGQNLQSNGFAQSNKANLQNAKIIQNPNIPNIVAFQLIPSVSYQIEDEKEQQRLLNAFNFDEFGSPRQQSARIQDTNSRQNILTSDINYSIEHTPSNKQTSGQYNVMNALYNGPSSYSAPQASIGNLGTKQANSFSSRLELENNNGYPKVIPNRQFNF